MTIIQYLDTTTTRWHMSRNIRDLLLYLILFGFDNLPVALWFRFDQFRLATNKIELTSFVSRMDRMQKLVSMHPWSTLPTISTFDLGDETNASDNNGLSVAERSTQVIKKINLIGLLKANASTPISLLIESLVQQLCSLLEPDIAKASQIYQVICEKLYAMKLIDESYSMEEFELMRGQYQRAFYHLVGVAKNDDCPVSIPAVVPPPNTAVKWSRYHREFEEIECIGRGGFGHVFRAKHRLDNSEYAIKKIYIRTDTVKSVMNHIEEVRALANLNHINVVPYKAAWMESSICDDRSAKMSTINDSFTCTTSSSDTQDDSFRFEKSQSSDLIIEFADSDVSSRKKDSRRENQLCVIDDNIDSVTCTKLKTEWAILYIQMSLCQRTLKDWLDMRNTKERLTPPISPMELTQRISVVENMFTQVVEGLHYIHSKGYVHHDIKPTNIFVSNELGKVKIQLGDFGLACHFEKTHIDVGQGTQLYAAPEQLEGKCNPKSDMFSLGIVLLELIECFNTDMERSRNISDLRKGRLAAEISAAHPQLAHIICQLVAHKPSKRPDAQEILSQLANAREIANANVMAQQLREKDAEIQRLRAILKQVGYSAI